jgi:death on curing protein
MTSHKWLTREAIEIIHRKQPDAHGDLAEVKGDNALETALARPINKSVYGETDIHVLAAAYLYGFVKNHPFNDGNKRTGYLAAFTFLYINGWIIEASQAEVIEFVLEVAAGDIDEDGATRFLRDFTVPL